MKVSALDPETLDSFYAELRRCRAHCRGRQKTQHYTTTPHQCDARCGKHVCRPLGATTVRHMHFILSGAYKRAVRWKWVAVNPCSQAEPPPAPTPNPDPASPSDAAQIVNAAWRDPDWGTLVWVAMTTGARRGELCGLRWSHVDLTAGREVLGLRRAISHSEHGWIEGELKTHQQRRVALDPETVAVLTEHRERVAARAVALGFDVSKDAFVFSPELDGSRFLAPSSLTQRYDRLAARLGIETTFHKLRHYSATELIAAGIDVRTVAGRLGHSGGGTTTLRAYAAWVSEADQRAAREIGGTMPRRPIGRDPIERASAEPASPYELIASDIQSQIVDGSIAVGEPLPSLKELARTHSVATSTAQRAVGLLGERGLVEVRRGQRAVVLARSSSSGAAARVVDDPAPAAGAPDREGAQLGVGDRGRDGTAVAKTSTPQLWPITLRGPDGHRYPARHVHANIDQPDSFRAHLLAIARIEVPIKPDSGNDWISDYELEVRPVGQCAPSRF